MGVTAGVNLHRVEGVAVPFQKFQVGDPEAEQAHHPVLVPVAGLMPHEDSAGVGVGFQPPGTSDENTEWWNGCGDRGRPEPDRDDEASGRRPHLINLPW